VCTDDVSPDRSIACRYFEDLSDSGAIALADEILDPAILFAGPTSPEGYPRHRRV
jgi:hypothetical protein